jgi:PIN domain nuclease of toxin-antitoxin system
MGKVVLDASSVLAALNKEPGGDLVLTRLDEAVISAVNFAEIVSRLTRTGGDIEHILSDLQQLLPDIRPFNASQALATGLLHSPMRDLGLSFGGRACLGLAISLGVPVLTADPTWSKLDIGVQIELIQSMPAQVSVPQPNTAV